MFCIISLNYSALLPASAEVRILLAVMAYDSTKNAARKMTPIISIIVLSESNPESRNLY
jgi:hypothetical protein